MERYLITHSLLNSWLRTMKDNPRLSPEKEDEPFKEFMSSLNREPFEKTVRMQKGNDFEALITNIVNGIHDTEDHWYDAALEIANIIKGGSLQHKAKTDIQVDGINFLLYGRLDALKGGRIYDIKYSESYECGKYFDSTQHPVYLELIPEASSFTYLISNGSSVWSETYRRDEMSSIHPVISDFIEWLKVQGLYELYREKWLTL